MRSALYCDPISRDRNVGHWDAFMATWERLDEVRTELSETLGVQLMPEYEIHYVHYEHGGYYQRHTDDEDTGAHAESRRCVSFILYLTPTEQAWEESDGGSLRAYSDGEQHVDYWPESGSLVLFDSCRLQHEVMPTMRKRTCLIGWFHTPAAT